MYIYIHIYTLDILNVYPEVPTGQRINLTKRICQKTTGCSQGLCEKLLGSTEAKKLSGDEWGWESSGLSDFTPKKMAETKWVTCVDITPK